MKTKWKGEDDTRWRISNGGKRWVVWLRSDGRCLLLRQELNSNGTWLYEADGLGVRTANRRNAKVFATTSRRDGCYRAARRLEQPKLAPSKPEPKPKTFEQRAIDTLAGLSRAQVLAAHDALWPPSAARSSRKARRVNSLQMRLRLAMALQSSVLDGRTWEGECVLEEPLASLFVEARERTPKTVKNWKAEGASPPPVVERSEAAFREAIERTGCSG